MSATNLLVIPGMNNSERLRRLRKENEDAVSQVLTRRKIVSILAASNQPKKNLRQG